MCVDWKRQTYFPTGKIIDIYHKITLMAWFSYIVPAMKNVISHIYWFISLQVIPWKFMSVSCDWVNGVETYVLILGILMIAHKSTDLPSHWLNSDQSVPTNSDAHIVKSSEALRRVFRSGSPIVSIFFPGCMLWWCQLQLPFAAPDSRYFISVPLASPELLTLSMYSVRST